MQVFEKETFILEKLGHAVESVWKKIIPVSADPDRPCSITLVQGIFKLGLY